MRCVPTIRLSCLPVPVHVKTSFCLFVPGSNPRVRVICIVGPAELVIATTPIVVFVGEAKLAAPVPMVFLLRLEKARRIAYATKNFHSQQTRMRDWVSWGSWRTTYVRPVALSTPRGPPAALV